MACDPMDTGPLTLVAPAFAQALMVKQQEEADEQMRHRKMRLDVSMPACHHVSTSLRQPQSQGSQVG